MSLQAKVDALLRSAVANGDVPGVVALATDGDETVYEGGFGERVLGGGAAMSPDTVVWIASMTKAITAAAAMQLVEQGRLDLDRPARDVVPALAEVVDSELVFRRGAPPHAAYTFKHALVQDAAYASLLRSKRQQLHARIAVVLEEQFPETAETRPELLAHHFAEGGLNQQAIAYLQRAGERAIERSAYAEAIGHLTRGLELLQPLPEAPERVLQELDLRIALGSALMATRGYAGREVEGTYLRARELCRRAGEMPRLFPVLHGLYRFYHVRGELQAAREVGEQLLQLAQSLREPALFVEAHRGLGVPLFWLGEVKSALAELDQGIAAYEAHRHRSHASVYGIDPGVVCLSYSALGLWHLGHTRRALDPSHEAF